MLSWPENPAFYNQLSRGWDVKKEKYDRSPRDTVQTAKDDLEFPIPAELAFQIATSVVAQAGLKLIIFLFHPPEFWDLAKSFKGRLYKSDTTQKKSSGLLCFPYLGFPLGLSLGSKAWPSCWSSPELVQYSAAALLAYVQKQLSALYLSACLVFCGYSFILPPFLLSPPFFFSLFR